MPPRRSARFAARADGNSSAPQQAAAGDEEEQGCPICFEAFTVADRAPCKEYFCTHTICATCDSDLFVRADDRCPTCRADRTHASKHNRTQSELLQRARAIAARNSTLPDGAFPQTVFFPVDAGGAGGLYGQADDGDNEHAPPGVSEEYEIQHVLLMDAQAVFNANPARGTVAPTSAGRSSTSQSRVAAPLLVDLRTDPVVANAVRALENIPSVNLRNFAAAAAPLRALRLQETAVRTRSISRTHAANGATVAPE
tara:strand:- start:2093 stop:2857 length:765 start_codon:yes stop_codon:yes gene_type:complete